MEAAELRPMSLGEILDRTFTLYRNHFLVFIGIMMVPYLFQLVMNLASQAIQPSVAPGQPAEIAAAGVGLAVIIAIIGFVLFVLTYGVTQGAAAFAVSSLQMGRPVSVRESYGQVKGHVGRAMNVMFTIFARVLGAFLLVVFPIGMMVGALAVTGAGFAAVAAVPIAIVLFFIPAMLLLCRYSLAIPAAMLEDIKTRPALRRSIVLIKGSYGRAFLVILLVLILSYVAMAIFQLPVLMVIGAAALRGEQPGWLLTLSGIAGFIGSTLVGPIWPIAVTLIYYDERIRKEAFDLQLMMQALDGAVPSPGSTPPLDDAGSAAVPRQFS